MRRAGSARPWSKAATTVALAYVLLLQLFLTGAVAAQMALAPASSGPILCLSESPHAPSGDEGKALAHVGKCVVCALASVTPALPGGPALPAPAATRVPPIPLALATAPDARRADYGTRSAQGPPATV